MAVAHDVISESHTGITGSTNEASFSWTHTPAGAPAGVLVYTFNASSATDTATSVTYGGSSLTAVPGAFAKDTAVEPGNTKAWFLGSSVPTGAQTVVVNRTNNANIMWAVAITVTAGANTEVYEPGIVLVQEDNVYVEVNVDDGSPGTNSLRYAGQYSGISGGTLTAGANTTLFSPTGSISFGPNIIGTGRETTAGQGSRLVGLTGVSNDRAGVYLAIKEAAAGATSVSTPLRNLTALGT